MSNRKAVPGFFPLPSMRRLSDDLRARVPVMFWDQNISVKNICSYLGIRKSLVYNILAQYRDLGRPKPALHRQGYNQLLNKIDIRFLSSLIDLHPCLYLDEIQSELEKSRRIIVSIPTLVRALRKLDISRKTVSVRALERNDLKRSLYMLQIARLAPRPDMLVFIDEAARNAKTSLRKFGRAKRGYRCVQRREFVRGARVSILPAITIDGIVAYDVIPGSVTTCKFLKFLERHVVCFLLLPM